MRYRATIRNHPALVFDVEVDDGREPPQVVLNGNGYTADLQQVDAHGLYSLLLDGRSYEVLVMRVDNDYQVDVDGHSFTVSLQDERRGRVALEAAGPPRAEGEEHLCAPMPGLVLRVNVQPGEAVQRGKALVVLQAMKMENDLLSQRDGFVKEVRATPGQKVDKGQVLVVVA